VTFASFDDAAVMRADLRQRYRDVSIDEVGDDALTAEQIGAATVRLELTLRNGSVRRYARTAAPGSPGDPLSGAELRAKWVDCLARACPDLPASRAAYLYDEGAAELATGTIAGWLPSLWAELAQPVAGQPRLAAS